MSDYNNKERARYWPITPELMAQYRDGSHTKNESGSLEWHQNGKLHRDGDLPAWIDANGSLWWFQNAQYHRDGDKPAVIGASGALYWYQNNQRHRICGPAVIYQNGICEWWINGKDITPEIRTWLNKKTWHGTTEQIFEFQLRFT